MPDSNKPIGSGLFGLVCGVLFVVVAFVFADGMAAMKPAEVLRWWLGISGAVLVVWGASRILTTSARRDMRIGMDTINMVVTMVGVTFAIWAIVLDRR